MNGLHKTIMERALIYQTAPRLQILSKGMIRPLLYRLPEAIEFELPWEDENDPLGMPATVRFFPTVHYLPDKIRITWRLEKPAPDLDFCGQSEFHFDFYRPEDFLGTDLRIFGATGGQEIKTKHFELREDGASLE
jgi:hypothetical protein